MRWSIRHLALGALIVAATAGVAFAIASQGTAPDAAITQASREEAAPVETQLSSFAPIPAFEVLDTTAAPLVIRAGEREPDYYLDPGQVTVLAGRIRVLFVNEGNRAHTFNVKNRGEWTDMYNFALVNPGEQLELEFSITEPGAYVIFCMLYKQVDHGQTGVLTIVP